MGLSAGGFIEIVGREAAKGCKLRAAVRQMVTTKPGRFFYLGARRQGRSCRAPLEVWNSRRSICSVSWILGGPQAVKFFVSRSFITLVTIVRLFTPKNIIFQIDVGSTHKYKCVDPP